MNIKKDSPEEKVSTILRAISAPNRFRILAAIGSGEVCVCHLEALLDLRQAYLSQQLIVLRDAGLLETRRDGRYIYYRMTQPEILKLLMEIGQLFGIPSSEVEALINAEPIPQCCCPNCLSQLGAQTANQTKSTCKGDC